MRDVQHCDLVVAQVKHSQTLEVSEVLDFGDTVVVQIEHIQAREILEVLDLFNVVLSKNQNSEVLDWWNDIDFSQLVHGQV